MFNKFSKGSLWRKFDIHAHTPLDHEWINKPDLSTIEKKKAFAKEYIQFAKGEGLEVIGITDHNFCNDISDLIIPFITDEANINDITILPGFEITVKDGSGIHVLVLFREKTSVSDVYEIVKRLFALGTILVPSDGQVPVCQSDLDELKQELDDSKMDYLLVFAHADRENGVLDKSTIVGERRIQEWQKKFIKICQLSKARESFPIGCFIEQVINKKNIHYLRDICYIVSSDCRAITKIGLEEGRHFLGEKFTWIKADPTFEGLQQIIFEPLSRVKVQEEKPEQKTPYLFIDKIRFNSETNELKFSNKFIEINPNLNSIIGGKSSGKSLLLYYIAKTIDPEQVANKYHDLGLSEEYSFESDIAGFDFEVTWGDGITFKLSDSASSKKRQITYIPQMYINHLAEKRGKDELKSLIQSILEEKPDFLEYYTNAKSEISRFKLLTQNKISQYFELEKKLREIETQLRNKGDKSARQQNLSNRQSELAALRIESGFTEEQEEDYNKQINLKSIHEHRLKNLTTLKEVLIDEYSVELKNIEEENKTRLNRIAEITVSKFTSEETKNAYSKAIRKYEEELLAPFQRIHADILLKIEKIDRCVQKSSDKIVGYDSVMLPYLEKITKKEKLLEIQQNIMEEESILSQISELQQQESLLKKQMNDLKFESEDSYEKMMKEYQKIVEKINQNYSDINSEKKIKLKARLSFDSEIFFHSCTKHINKQIALSSIGSYFNLNEFVFTENNHLNDIKDFFSKILETDIKYNQGGSRSIVCSTMLADYFSIDFEIFEKEESIFKMSPGKKGLILLYLILHLSHASYPILIDQPEDNLDNRTVYKELKDFIKSKKIERQILIVTHNANLVVPTDSENVIVANQSGQDKGKDNATYRFEYISGSLENTFIDNDSIGILNKMGIREHVCEILEGGEDAFKERELRYSLD